MSDRDLAPRTQHVLDALTDEFLDRYEAERRRLT